MRRRFVTRAGHQLFDDDELGLGSGSGAQVLQYGEAIFISPVMENFADEEDGDAILLRRLWVEEIVAFVKKPSASDIGVMQAEINRLWGFTRPDSSASGIFFFQNYGPYFIRYIPYPESVGLKQRTSTACLTTGSRSWTTNRS